MSAPHKYDYDSLEREYVQGSMSIRQLCKDNGIATFSTVAAYARRNDWDAKRERFQDRLREAETKAVVQKRADALASSLDDAVKVAHKSIYRFLDSLEDRWIEHPNGGEPILIPAQEINAREFTEIVKTLQLLAGQPTSRDAHVGVNITGELDAGQVSMEFLRDIANIARERGAGTGTAQSSPLPRIEGARKVN